MKKKNQTEVIVEAFKANIPENENEWPEYYKQRMKLCAACDKNTANGAWGKAVSFAVKKTNMAQCSVCLCYIKEKCWSKHEACGLEEIGEKPKWNRLLVETVEKDLFNVSNRSFETCNIDLAENGNEFVADLGTIHKSDTADVRIRVECKKGYLLASSGLCGCMSLTKRSMLSKGTYDFDVHLNNPIELGHFNKLVLLEFMEESLLDDKSIAYDAKEKHSFLLRIKANVIDDEITQGHTEAGSAQSDNQPSE